MTLTLLTPPAPIDDALTRRQFVISGTALAALVVAGCGDDGPDGGDAAPRSFAFTDDEGVSVSLDRVPERLAAWVTTAASLAEFGITIDGVWGPPDLARGVDLSAAQSFGGEFNVNIEALAAARPELIIGTLWDGGNSLPQEEELANVRAIAPMIRLEGNADVVPAIEAHERLAVALGADPDAPALKAAREEFHAARDALTGALADKPGLKVLILSLLPDAVYVSYLNLGVTKDLAALGMDIHDNVDGIAAWDDGLSWELVPELAADLIIWDQRSQYLTPDDLAGHPIWTSLPAVRGGQVVPFQFDPLFSYAAYTRQYRTLTDAVRAARADLVP